MALRESVSPPAFLGASRGGHFKGKDPSEPIERLESEWVEEAVVLYIGMTTTTRRKRVGDYARFGSGTPIGHWGGRFIWQLADSPELKVCWKVTDGDHAERTERSLLDDFQLRYGRLPFANLR